MAKRSNVKETCKSQKFNKIHVHTNIQTFRVSKAFLFGKFSNRKSDFQDFRDAAHRNSIHHQRILNPKVTNYVSIMSIESVEAYISPFVELQVYKPHQYVKADQE